MMTDAPSVAPATRKPRRPGARSTKATVDKPAKTAVYLSAESMRRLGLTALMEGRSQSDIVDQLIRENLRRYRVQTLDRAAPEDSDGQATGMGSATAA